MRILKKFVMLVVLIGCSTLGPPAEHPWFEIRSPHFIAICNGSEKDGRDATVDLERMRAVFMKALPGLRQDPNVPIVVFMTPDESTFATLVPIYRERPGGNKPYSMFQRGRDRNYIVLRVGFRTSTEFSVKYDYAGLLAGVNFGRAPLWFRTGVAEFFAVSEITEDQGKVGMPSPRFVRRLETMHLVPFPRLMAVGTNSPEYIDPSSVGRSRPNPGGYFITSLSATMVSTGRNSTTIFNCYPQERNNWMPPMKPLGIWQSSRTS